LDEADGIGAGYTYDEKMHIARRFLLPKQLNANGMDASHVEVTEPALLTIATQYTREAGVRSLERAIGAVVRYKAVEWAEHVDEQEGRTEGRADKARAYSSVVEESELESILGIARWDGEEREREERRGVVYGLVVMGQGEGGILPVETIVVPGSGRLKLTGSLGEVCLSSRCCGRCVLRTFFLPGHQGEWRDRAELGQDACLRSVYNEFACT
jgi:ATP-dependent Lon protease